MKSLESREGLTHGRGLIESVKTLWVNSQYACSLIYSAMITLTSNQTVSSHHHEELGVLQDRKEMQKI